MGFLVNKITGNGTAQTVITNGATLEAVVNSLVAFNTTGGALSFSLLVNDSIIFTERVAANSTFRIPDKINLGAASTLKVNSATGLDVTVSYLQQAIDAVSALSAAQIAAQDAVASALTATDAAGSTALDAARAKAAADSAVAITGLPSPTGHDDEVLSVSGSAMAWAKRDRAVPLAEGTITAGACDYATGYVFSKTISGATTISLTNVPATGTAMLMLRLTNGGSATVTWPSGIKWPGGTAPTLTASGLDEVVLMRTKAGVWSGAVRKDVK